MKKGKKKVYTLALSIFVLLIVGYIFIQWNYIRNTDEVPYRNLRDFSSGGCLIYFDIEYNGTTYPVVYNNSRLISALSRRKNKIFALMGPMYLNEVIKRDWSISVDDSLFLDLQPMIVDKQLIEKYQGRDLISDTSIVANNRIKYNLAGEHYKAIMYVLLHQDVNVCQDDETGAIIVHSNRPDQ